MRAFSIRRLVRKRVKGRSGIEIGGPSELFRTTLPVYPHIGRLDNVNYSASTVWEGEIAEGDTFRFDPGRPAGRQYVSEATDLPVGEQAYDAVLSSHTLEHVANPLRALAEWRRVVRDDDGTLVLVLPHRALIFDHRRPVTAFEHLVADYEQETTESDLTHLPEILELHDLSRDKPAGDAEAFRARSLENATNRCLHHHVFDEALAARAVEWAGFDVLGTACVENRHTVVIARTSER
jgi:SAM-dependent methyltransferase